MGAKTGSRAGGGPAIAVNKSKGGEVMDQQLAFGFVAVMERELSEKQEQEELERKRRIKDSWLHSAVEDLPPTSEEWDIILMGIRLCRHVHPSECEKCKLDRCNHCPDALGTCWDDTYKQYIPIKVCLRDYFRWLAQHGLKAWVKEALSK